MKKVFTSLLMAIVLLSATNVCAMSEDQLKEKLTGSYIVNGAVVKVSDTHVAQIERYLAQNDVSESDADYIAAKIDEAITVMESGNATRIEDLTQREKDKIISIINDVSNKTAVKISVQKGGVLAIYNTDGTLFTKITDVIKYTDATNTYLIASLTATGLIITSVILGRKFLKKND